MQWFSIFFIKNLVLPPKKLNVFENTYSKICANVPRFFKSESIKTTVKVAQSLKCPGLNRRKEKNNLECSRKGQRSVVFKKRERERERERERTFIPVSYKTSRLRFKRLCFIGVIWVQTLHATLCGHFLPRPRGGEITRNKLYISL